jgi:hypothetical protein
MGQISTPSWDDLRRIADELEVKMHLASMEARARWNDLQPKLAEVEQAIARGGERAGEFVTDQISSLAAVLGELRDEIQHKLETQRPRD